MKLSHIDNQINESLFTGIVKFVLAAGAVIAAVLLIRNVFFKKDLQVKTGKDSEEIEAVKSGDTRTFDIKLEFDLKTSSMKEITKTADRIMGYFTRRYRTAVDMYGTERKGNTMYVYYPFTSNSDAKRAANELKELLQDSE